ncbi:MAG: tRNA pseudouridine(55) synthase TruB [Candidatus Omnitrophota bacterium]
MNGIILVDKPKGFTSFDAVNFIKKRFSLAKVGHAGTLDPLATGLLVILIGKATKLAETFLCDSKIYSTVMTLGIKTDTFDVTGKITAKSEEIPSVEKIIETLKNFEGDIEQVPPVFSAIQYKGQRLYKLARKGTAVVPEKRKVFIYYIKKIKFLPASASDDYSPENLRILKYDPDTVEMVRRLPQVSFEVKCSKGTYIRSLCEDAGEALNCPAVLKELRRTSSGEFELKDAVTIEKLKNMTNEDLAEILISGY